MIIVIDGLNRNRFEGLLDEMFRLRARVFGDRLGWDVAIENGRESDIFDTLDPAYVLGLDDDGHVVSCVRALQTTGPHMLADVFSDILDGEPPLRSATVWESTRFCVDTDRLTRGSGRNSISYATCELMAGSLEYARACGVSDIVTVIDPVMDRVLRRSNCAPYDYLGRLTPMGKVSALAALLDCTEDRIAAVRNFAGITGEIFADSDALCALADRTPRIPEVLQSIPGAAIPSATAVDGTALEAYCSEQIRSAKTGAERRAAEDLIRHLHSEGVIAAPETLN